MPGIVQGATSVLVLPDFLSQALSKELKYIAKVNDYNDGTSQRDLITFADRRAWTLQPKGQQYAMEALRVFYENVFGPMLPFYFYDFSDSSPAQQVVYDPTGNATLGRYMVRFDGPWEQVFTKGRSCGIKTRTALNLIIDNK